MSVTLEQVEQLRAHAAVSYEEARRALEACDGDLLDALILLEREGRIPPGGGRGAFFTGGAGAPACGSCWRRRWICCATARSTSLRCGATESG